LEPIIIMSEQEKKITTEDEIDLIEVFKKIWAKRMLIYKVVAVFFVLGLIIAFGTPKEYKAETTLLVETGGGSSMNGLLQQFGGLAGINLGGGQENDMLSPEIYPQIIQSTPFLIEIMAEKIHSSKTDSAITVFQYLSTLVKPSVIGVVMSYTIGLPGKVVGLFKKKEKPDYSLPLLNNEPLVVTKQQEGIMGALNGRIKLKPDETNGTLVISTEMPDPVASAELTNHVYKYLSKYLVEYKIQKVKTDLEFIAKQHTDAKQRYMEAQQRLAYYRDANRNVSLASSRTEEERLQNEYTLAFNVYNGLSQQLEQSKLKVQEKTPVLKVMDPVKVPLDKSKPKRSLTIVAFLLIGVILSISLILVEPIIKNFNE
jgi:uncharacterized protein involved in exopolysaccharide biosynthesis